MTEEVHCAICKQPIERRRDLFILLDAFRLVPMHYMCHIDDRISRGKHWSSFHIGAANSFIRKIVLPLFWVSCFIFLLRLGLETRLYSLWALTWILLIPSIPAFIAYFKYERKVPK